MSLRCSSCAVDWFAHTYPTLPTRAELIYKEPEHLVEYSVFIIVKEIYMFQSLNKQTGLCFRMNDCSFDRVTTKHIGICEILIL